MHELPLILQLDQAGNPKCWINYEKASYYACKGLIAWTMNATDFTLHGGTNAASGKRSLLTLETIIAIKGKVTPRKSNAIDKVPLTNKTLFRRDANMCAYCGIEFAPCDLSRDHVIPTSKGGSNTWLNVVTACTTCNKWKDDLTPQQAGMELLYVPYAPSRSEYLILSNKKILADQMEFLLTKVPKESRLKMS